MGDTTFGQLFVYAVPPHQVQALYDVLIDGGLGPTNSRSASVRLGARGYAHRGCSVGWMFDDAVPDALVAASPDATWLA
jgi:hypothetical protein